MLYKTDVLLIFKAMDFLPVLMLFFAGIFFIAVLVLTLVALVDLLGSRFRDNDKLVWALVIIFVTFIGPILYFVMGRKQKIKQDESGNEKQQSHK